jgi:hypothetical protein
MRPASLRLTPREGCAARALDALANYEILSRAIWDTVSAPRPIGDHSAPPEIPHDQQRQIDGRYEVYRQAALVYAKTLGDVQLIEAYQQPVAAPEQNAKAPAPIEDASDSPTSDVPATEAAPVETAGASDGVDFCLLATRRQLIDAFGTFTGMEASWFDNITDTPALLAARKIAGQGGRHSAEPLFCPFEVMQWLIDAKRRKGRPISNETAWRMLKAHFSKVYDLHSIGAPTAD